MSAVDVCARFWPPCLQHASLYMRMKTRFFGTWFWRREAAAHRRTTTDHKREKQARNTKAFSFKSCSKDKCTCHHRARSRQPLETDGQSPREVVLQLGSRQSSCCLDRPVAATETKRYRQQKGFRSNMTADRTVGSAEQEGV